MRKSRLLAALVVAGLCGLGVAIYLKLPREPIYQGKPASYWIRGLHSLHVARNEAAHAALRQMGTNALPTLLRMIQAKDSKIIMRLRDLSFKQSLVRHHFTWAEEYRLPAVSGFRQLGPAAKSAVPALIALLADDEVANDAGEALAGVGSEAVLPLISALTDQNRKIRLGAIETLGRMGPTARRAVPALSRCLGEESAVRSAAADALKKIDPEALVKGRTE